MWDITSQERSRIAEKSEYFKPLDWQSYSVFWLPTYLNTFVTSSFYLKLYKKIEHNFHKEDVILEFQIFQKVKRWLDL